MSLHPDDVKTKRCAVCKRQRQEANHWFLVRVDGSTPQARDGSLAKSFYFAWRGELRVIEWNAELAEMPEWRTVCGEAHLNKMIARWISIGSLDAPTAPLADSTPRKEISE